MRVVFAGTPDVAVPVLEALAASEHDLVGVVTRPDARSGRGKRLVASPVAERGEALGIPVAKPGHPREPEFQQWLRELRPEVVVVVAYGALLPQSALDIPEHGWVNLHFSLLPAWRGAAPVQHSIIAGEPVTGATTFQIVRELDAGPLFRTVRYEVPADATAGRVLAELAVLGGPLVLATLDDIAAGRRPVAQSSDGVSLAPKITVEDARIDWSATASAIGALVRGTNPAPGAWTTLAGERFKVLAISATDEHSLAPGGIRPERRRLVVGTGSGDVELPRVQAVGKKPMSGADWARGVTLAADARFE